MKAKALLVCLFTLAVKSTESDEFEYTDSGDTTSKTLMDIQEAIKNEQPIITLKGVTPEEKAKLQSFIGSAIDPLAKDYSAIVTSKLSLAQLNSYPPDIHIIASKIALQYVHHNMNKPIQISEYINSPECKIMTEEIPGQRPWTFDHNSFLKAERLILDFNDIYAKWFSSSPDVVKYRLYLKQSLSEEDVSAIRQHMLKHQKNFADYFELFQAKIKPTMDEYRNGFCNLKNFLSYFELLPRFFATYKIVPDGFVKKIRFHDLGSLMGRFRRRIKFIFNLFARVELNLQIINEYYFYLKQTPSLEADQTSLPLYHDAMLDIVENAAEVVKGLCFVKSRLERYYIVLKFIIYSLEDAAEIESLPFLKLKFHCGVIRLAVGFFALILSLFFV